MARGHRTGRRAGPERRCIGKRKFPTSWKAQAALEALARDQGIYLPAWRTYRCGHCDHYHIGHRPGLGRERGI